MKKFKQIINEVKKPDFKSFTVKGKVNTVRGTLVKGHTYEITAGDATVCRCTNPKDERDWANVLSGVLNVAKSEGNITVTKK